MEDKDNNNSAEHTHQQESTANTMASAEHTHQQASTANTMTSAEHTHQQASTANTMPSAKGDLEDAITGDATEESEIQDIDEQERVAPVGSEDEESEEAEKIDWSKEPALEDASRNQMFEDGLKLDKEGRKLEALKRYLKCLVGLKENSRFALLPQCLRNIGDIYYNRNEYDKAISFIQAEKLYYENVLIDDTELQKHIDEVTAEGAEGTSDTNIDALRATEYEQLAKLCMDEKQPQLALEYAGKCTKLRQKVYGDGHPLVQQSLDYFATVYAEVGKVQYTESMSIYDQSGEPDITSPYVSRNTTSSPSSSEPTSILRRRKTTVENDKEKKVRFDESQVPADDTSDGEERCARAMLLILFLMLLFVFIVLGLYLFCNLQSTSSTCKNYRVVFNDYVMKLKYFYYYFLSSRDSKYS